MRFSLASMIVLVSITGIARAEAPALDSLPLLDKVQQGHITWHFDKPVRVGQFVNGDYYVVGPVTVTAIDPAPAAGRHGSVKNIGARPGNRSGFDSRTVGNRYSADLRADPPIELKPGDNLISSKSAEGQRQIRCLFNLERNVSPVLSYSVLTVLAEPVPADTFRPGYCDRQQRMYRARDLQWWRLHNLEHVEHTPDIERWAKLFRQPWLDIVFYNFDAAAEYQPQYAREIARAESFATLLLNMDFPREKKEPLLVNFVQYGIDLWSIIRDGEHGGWMANGGHGSGRKWGIVFAGMMLGDEQMASPSKALPNVRFGQDMQTMYAKAWTGANVVYAGHRGVWKGEPVSNNPAQMPYEHLQPREWAYNTFKYAWREGPTTQYEGEVYRRDINSKVWVGIGLAGRIMRAEPYYGHDAFFDYVDRWMTEDDAKFREELMKQIDAEKTAHDFREKKWHAGVSYDPFIDAMWKAYRNNLPEKRQPE